MERNLRKKLLGTLAPYVPKKDIAKIFGQGATTAFYDILKTEGIPRWRDSVADRKAKILKDWKKNEERLKEESINEAKRILNGSR
jgi:hypothetical protein